MTKIPETLQASMAKFAELIETMEHDTAVIQAVIKYDEARQAMLAAEEEANLLRAPFQQQIDVLADNIKERTLELGTSIEHASVKVSHRKAHERVTWNNKWLTSLCMDNPALLHLLGDARKVTQIDASVSLKYTPPEPEEGEVVEAPF